MLDARPGFIIKFLKRSLIVNLFKTQAFDCQSAVFDMLGLRTIKSTLMHECEILDKATYRHRATLESWHTATTVNSDNNAQHLPEQYRFLLKKNRS